MNALLLPGNSPRHREWVDRLYENLSPQFDSAEVQYYRHWQTGEKKADVGYEMVVAKDKAAKLGSYAIVAKSIGTVIAARGTAEGLLSPDKLVLLGVPINGGAPRDQFYQWLDHIGVPVVVVQNEHDTLGSFDDVKAAFDGSSEHITFVETPGDTHDYLDFEAIAKLI